MNERAARHIVKQGVIPGEIDSVDLWRAEGYLEAIDRANILKDTLNLAHELHSRGQHIATQILKDSLDKWEKEK